MWPLLACSLWCQDPSRCLSGVNKCVCVSKCCMCTWLAQGEVLSWISDSFIDFILRKRAMLYGHGLRMIKVYPLEFSLELAHNKMPWQLLKQHWEVSWFDVGLGARTHLYNLFTSIIPTAQKQTGSSHTKNIEPFLTCWNSVWDKLPHCFLSSHVFLS